MIEINPNGDLIIKVIEFDDTVIVTDGGLRPILCEEEFLVNRETVRKHSSPLASLIDHHLAQGKKNSIFTLKGDSVVAMDLWFRSMHDNLGNTHRNIALSEVWYLGAASHKYEPDAKALNEWFAGWYQENISKIRRQKTYFREMLFPCWLFSHASGFFAASKTAVYHSRGYIGEHSPIQYHRSHLPSEVIQQVNAAKGRLRTILHAAIFNMIEKLLDSSCDLKEEILFGYVKALRATEVWPFDVVWGHMEVNSILNRLAEFEYRPPAKTIDHGSDYWKHNNFDEATWDRGCRVSHGEPTRYFSFMGRRDERANFFRAKKMPLGAPAVAK
ncbi:MAG: hypothetical protein Q9203_007013, partial [Teloschistes exilis]